MHRGYESPRHPDIVPLKITKHIRTPQEVPAMAIDKSKLPSRYVSVGPESAPHRSYYYAMGMTDEEIAQPFVGVATCWNEAAPCNISLMRPATSR
jgi:dihydroxy-acid dehydratase